MKRAAILVMVVVLLAISITPAFAQDRRSPDRFQLTGTVEEVDVAAGTITVSIIGYSSGNPVASTHLTIQTTERTRFSYSRQASITDADPPTIEDVTVGEKIAVQGFIQEQVHIATHVTLRVPNETPQPTRTPQATPEQIRFSVTGNVEAVDVDAGTITVKVITYASNMAITLWPERLTIQTTNSTRWEWVRLTNAVSPSPPTIEDVEVGDWVGARGVVRDRVHVATHVVLRYPWPTVTPEPKFALTGTVEAVDVDAGTITVSVINYHPPQTTERPPLLVIQTTDETRFKYAPPGSATNPPTIKDVVVGEKIKVHGAIREGVHVALEVLMRPNGGTPHPTRTPGAQETPGPRCTPTAESQPAVAI